MPRPKATDADRQIGARLRMRRQDMGYSQVRLAELVGVAWQSFQKWEKGKTRLSGHRIKQLSDVLDVPPSYFLGENADDAVKAVEVYATTPEGMAVFRELKRIQSTKVKRLLLLTIRAIADELEAKKLD